jgi:PKD repeat protein
LTGTVSSTTGQRISGATVAALDGPDAGRSAVTNASGEYRFESLTMANMNFRANASGYNENRAGTFVNGTSTLNFVLSPAIATLSGAVRSSGAGERLADMTVEIIDGPDRGRQTRTGSTGEYRLDSLAVGNVTVSARGSGHEESRRSINLVNGNNTLDFELTQTVAPVSIVAVGISSDPGGAEFGFEARPLNLPPSRFSWDFGDGGAVDNGRQQESHRYEVVGDYLVQVFVQPLDGGPTMTASLILQVRF